MRSYDRSYDPQVCNTRLSLLFPSETHTHTYTKALLSLTWWRFPARVTCTRVTVELSLFLYSNKHGLGVFTEWSATLTVQPQKTCTQVWCYLGSHKILGFRQKKKKSEAEDKASASGKKAIFWTFWDPYGKDSTLRASTAHTVCHTDPASTNTSSLPKCVWLFAFACSLCLSIHWKLSSARVYMVPADMANLWAAEPLQIWWS